MRASILFVDDDPGMTRMLQRLFRKSGYDMMTANDGKQALTLLAQKPFNVIVSDQCMPEMGGFRFLKEAHEKQPSAIKLMLSGREEAHVFCTTLRPEFINEFVLKPCFDDELIERIRHAVAESFASTTTT